MGAIGLFWKWKSKIAHSKVNISTLSSMRQWLNKEFKLMSSKTLRQPKLNHYSIIFLLTVVNSIFKSQKSTIQRLMGSLEPMLPETLWGHVKIFRLDSLSRLRSSENWINWWDWSRHHFSLSAWIACLLICSTTVQKWRKNFGQCPTDDYSIIFSW